MSKLFRGTSLVLILSACAIYPAAAQETSTSQMSLNEQDHQNESDDHDHEDEEATLDAVVVTSTRSGRMAQDNPMRVELINQEEIEEKAIMRPGNIATLVNETGGVRVQVTSPGLGAANVRIQGLYGRYTQILADGLPLYGGQSLGVLQIPPTDLGRVEVIKGSASSLYGASALGGVINLISRRPGDEANGEVLFNLTSRDGQDLTAYGETPINDELAVSLTAGAHRQSLEDFDQDGWIDLPAYERFTARPRLFWEDSEGNSIYATLGFMTEEREGGTRDGRTVPDGTYFPLTQDSTRIDGGVIARTEFSPDISGQIRASAMVQDHDHVYGDVAETDKHENYLLEASLTGQQSNWDWVLGLAYQSDSYSSETYPDFDFSYDVPGLFGQVDYDFTQDLSLSVSGRVDDHSEYGTQFSPRVSLLYRPGDWTIRGSVAEGFFAPTPFVEEIEASGLSRLLLLEDLEEETARTASLDVGYRRGPFEGNVTVFASDVENATILEEVSSTTNGPADRVRLVNLDGTTRIRGSELVLRYVWNDFKLTAAISTPIQASLLLTACPVTKSRSPHNTRQVWSLCGNAMVNSDWALKCTTLASSA